MKVTLDLHALVAEGKLTPEEAARLKQLALQDTGSLGANIVLALGASAIVVGLGALMPSPLTAIVLGALLFGTGMAIRLSGGGRWAVFGRIWLTIGALVLAGGLSWQFDGNVIANFAITAGLSVAAVIARSGLLAAVTVVGLSVTVGFAAGAWKVAGDSSIVRPTLTIVVLSVVALGLYLASKRLAPDLERVALIGARTAVLLVNFAFLGGSLFGDSATGFVATTFSVAWAAALLAVGAWAVWSGRRWVVNTVAVFGVIHFFVQWFMHFGASAGSILGGGALLVLFGFGLLWLNRQRWVVRDNQGLQSP